MTVRVRLFAALREAAGCEGWEAVLDAGSDVHAVTQDALVRFPALEPFAPVIRAAVNDAWARPDTRVQDGDEVALLSPVSGG
jgi:molybdopterin converting factor small subunit